MDGESRTQSAAHLVQSGARRTNNLLELAHAAVHFHNVFDVRRPSARWRRGRLIGRRALAGVLALPERPFRIVLFIRGVFSEHNTDQFPLPLFPLAYFSQPVLHVHHPPDQLTGVMTCIPLLLQQRI